MKLPWNWKNAPALAFAVVAFAGGGGLYAAQHRNDDQLYRSQIGGCERQNALRRESNQRIPAHEADTNVLHNFLVSASAARAAAYDKGHLATDREAAREYDALAHELAAKVHFNPLPIVNCHKVIPKP